MAKIVKFPPTVEIKRVIAAATRAGIEIGFIEIQPSKITIHVQESPEDPNSAYDLWKKRRGFVRHQADETDALPKKPRG